MENIFHVIKGLMTVKDQASQNVVNPGTQSNGAANEMKNVWEGWNKVDLVKCGASQGLEWIFTVAAS